MHTLPEDKIKTQEKNFCLSQRELLNYVTGKLSEKERKKVETHLVGCEKCISVYQEVLIKKETADINGKYADLFPEERKNNFKINFVPSKKIFTVVAIVLGVIVLVGAYSKFAKQQVKNDNAYSQISKPEVTTTEPVNNPDPVSSPPVKEEKIIPLPEAKKSIPEEIKADDKKIDETVPGKTKPLKEELKKPVEKTANVPATIVPVKVELPVKDSIAKLPAPPVAAFIKNYKVSKSPDELVTGNYAKALEVIFRQIDQADYKNALAETGKFLNDYPGDVNGKYYKGFIYYQAQDNDQALSEMNWIVNKHDKVFYDDARWYKALILNRTQKPDEAKRMLNDLVSQNSSYAVKAKQLLELMGDK